MRQVLLRNILTAGQRRAGGSLTAAIGMGANRSPQLFHGATAIAVRYLATVTEYFPNKVDFPSRHIGPRKTDVVEMLDLLGYKSLDDLTNEAVPRNIQLNRGLVIEEALSECAAFNEQNILITSPTPRRHDLSAISQK